MPSVVTIAPNGEGTLHSHPEEQWGVPWEGCAIRIQGNEEIAVAKFDCRRTPGCALDSIRVGPEGCQALEIFGSSCAAYRAAGRDFGTT